MGHLGCVFLFGVGTFFGVGTLFGLVLKGSSKETTCSWGSPIVRHIHVCTGLLLSSPHGMVVGGGGRYQADQALDFLPSTLVGDIGGFLSSSTLHGNTSVPNHAVTLIGDQLIVARIVFQMLRFVGQLPAAVANSQSLVGSPFYESHLSACCNLVSGRLTSPAEGPWLGLAQAR